MQLLEKSKLERHKYRKMEKGVEQELTHTHTHTKEGQPKPGIRKIDQNSPGSARKEAERTGEARRGFHQGQ